MNTQEDDAGLTAPTVWLQVDVAALSDVGRTRAMNQDCFGYDLEAGIFLVCDGMGGHAGGEVASRVAVDEMLLHYRELRTLGIRAEESLRRAMDRTNQAVWTMSQRQRELRGMGTTMVAACVDGNKILIGHVGDSRAYLVREGVCQQVTEDHSFVAEEARRRFAAGDRSEPEVGAVLPQWITRAVGVGPVMAPDLFTAELTEGDTLLLASDGLTRYAAPHAIAEAVSRTTTLPESCRTLLCIAEAGGAEDNVTCLLLRFIRN